MFTITSDSPVHTHTHECTQTHQKQFQGHESFPMQQNNFIYNDTHTSRQGRTLYHEKHSRWILQKTKSTIFQCPMYTHAHTNTEEELPLKNNCLYNNYYEEWWWSTHTHTNTSLGASKFSTGCVFISNDGSVIHNCSLSYWPSEHQILLSCGMVRNMNQQHWTQPLPACIWREQCLLTRLYTLYTCSAHPVRTVRSKLWMI